MYVSCLIYKVICEIRKYFNKILIKINYDFL
ncbi:unnamed protein product [Spirodela intermedia]|uniref:Uncharacterized protein n=2 Tax=Spirodela intermedia TaxID=51605 RepID=A0A7I8K9B8_SPIIN|nr:unnamed protein product [Spirodela intermedia]CAA6658151.1 unnamed protein product [Spirodela intermedia]CAA7394311.1 unnamed protein product [Spirodela intermedia]